MRTYGHLVRELADREIEAGVSCWHPDCTRLATHHYRWFGSPRSGPQIPWDGVSRWICADHAYRFSDRFRVRIVPTWPFGVGVRRG